MDYTVNVIQASRPRLGEVPSLTGLRGLACLAVFLCHSSDTSLAQMGRVAVTFFFVLSGFLMYFSIEATDYFLKRFARILPLYWLSLLASSYWDLACLRDTTCSGSTYITMILTPLTLQGWWPCSLPDWNSVTWSLSIESFCYLVAPLVYRRLRANSGLYCVTVGASCILITTLPWIITASISDATFRWIYCVLRGLPLLRCGDFILGLLAAHVYVHHKVSYRYGAELIALLLLGLLLGLPFHSEVWTYYLNVGSPVAALVAILVYTLALHPSLVSRFLGLRPWVYLGKVSYAFYLFHPLTAKFIYGSRNPTSMSPQEISVWFVSTVGVSTMLHFCVEQPLYDFLVRR